jgi:hypothetical protein
MWMYLHVYIYFFYINVVKFIIILFNTSFLKTIVGSLLQVFRSTWLPHVPIFVHVSIKMLINVLLFP